MAINEMSDKAILKELGLRISRYRLNKNMTQKILAAEAGVSISTIQRVESGASIQAVKLMRILRSLNLIENIEALVPEFPVSPIQQLKMMGKTRQRAFSPQEENKESKWSWEEKE
ncbi:MAG: helix-turn-helix transcriptional regulator [Candidatus Omnitrophica bacterium]|nr:helix-turn-helix transcriptional regulator [Candidatus Omnitrophota bacterium]MCK5492913.1 helix-turn-helix transcriptional regulator [Candidatus Omnitrophota bacterium]